MRYRNKNSSLEKLAALLSEALNKGQCDHCDGRGWFDSIQYGPKPCQDCYGTGLDEVTIFGRLSNEHEKKVESVV